jgi:hypothetical protein
VEQRAHLAEEVAAGEGLLEQRCLRHRPAVLVGHGRRVSGHHQHGQLRPQLVRSPGQLDAAHPRHDHIGDQQVELLPRVLEQADGLGSPARRGHLVAAVREDSLAEGADCILVLDQEDALASAHAVGDLLVGAGGHGGVHGRQVDPEHRPVARLAVQADLTARRRDDPVHGRQAEPRALALALGREERLEDARGHLRLHPAAVVGDRQPHVAPRRELGMIVEEVTVELHLAGLDHEAPAVLHGVAGIHRQVDQHLLDLAGVGPHRRHFASQLHVQLDVLAERPSQ